MSETMLTMRLNRAGSPLSLDSVALPEPRDYEVLLEMLACGVCRTDLHRRCRCLRLNTEKPPWRQREGLHPAVNAPRAA